MSTQIHTGQPVLTYGAPLEDAEGAVILLHGRGATADSMLPLAGEIDPGGLAFLVPQAGQNRWYPHSAFGPLELNEPDLTAALGRVDELVNDLLAQGISAEKIALGGFSQGACLASEYVARNAQRYGGLFLLSGALIGPEGTPRDYAGSFEDMPVFIGGSDVDPWVAHHLIADTAAVFEKLGAKVDFRTYSGMPHTVNADELDAVKNLLANL